MVNIFTGPARKRWSPLSITIATAIAVAAFFFSAYVLDREITLALTNWPPQIVFFFEQLTRLGESDWILIPTLLVWIIGQTGSLLPFGYRLKWRLRAFGAGSGFVFLAVAVPGIISALIKRGLGRARPEHLEELGTLHFEPQWADWTFQSFPSATQQRLLLWPQRYTYWQAVGALWPMLGRF